MFGVSVKSLWCHCFMCSSECECCQDHRLWTSKAAGF